MGMTKTYSYLYLGMITMPLEIRIWLGDGSHAFQFDAWYFLLVPEPR
jgi:hypothetical protein